MTSIKVSSVTPAAVEEAVLLPVQRGVAVPVAVAVRCSRRVLGSAALVEKANAFPTGHDGVSRAVIEQRHTAAEVSHGCHGLLNSLARGVAMKCGTTSRSAPPLPINVLLFKEPTSPYMCPDRGPPSFRSACAPSFLRHPRRAMAAAGARKSWDAGGLTFSQPSVGAGEGQVTNLGNKFELASWSWPCHEIQSEVSDQMRTAIGGMCRM